LAAKFSKRKAAVSEYFTAVFWPREKFGKYS